MRRGMQSGHNPAAGSALAQGIRSLPPKPTYLICGIMRTKDAAGYMMPLVTEVQGLTAVSIPGESATLSGAETAAVAASLGLAADIADTIDDAVRSLCATGLDARILICGSLYLAGRVLRENG